jgi:hypothetical protein
LAESPDERHPGDISSRSSQARDESGPNGVAKWNHDNRDRTGCVLRGLSGRGGGYDDDVRLESHAVGGEGGKSLALAIGGEVIDGDSLLIHITEITQALEERVESAIFGRPWIEREEAKPRNRPSRRLRLGSERPKTNDRGDGDGEPD